jgi:predicted transglutaminase-like cysteine proteinase
MKHIAFVLLSLLLLSGCGATAKGSVSANRNDRISPRQAVYYKAIVKWQDRLSEKSFQQFDCPQLQSMQTKIAAKGWSNETVDEIIEEIRTLTSLTMETKDYWDTPKEFVAKNLQGDCEDIAIFLLAMLKKLDYPGQVRIFAVNAQFVEHAMLKVQMPDKSWKMFETVKKTERDVQFAYTPIIEFDERNIIFATI